KSEVPSLLSSADTPGARTGRQPLTNDNVENSTSQVVRTSHRLGIGARSVKMLQADYEVKELVSDDFLSAIVIGGKEAIAKCNALSRIIGRVNVREVRRISSIDLERRPCQAICNDHRKKSVDRRPEGAVDSYEQLTLQCPHNRIV